MNLSNAALSFACTVGFIFAPAFANGQNTILIEGVVRDNAGNGLPGTQVEIFVRDQGAVRRTANVISSSQDQGPGKPVGYYSAQIPSGQPIRAIIYDNDRFQPRTVVNIAGERDDDGRINKLLLDRSGPLKFPLILDQIREYDAMFYLELEIAGGGSKNLETVKKKLRDRFAERIQLVPDPRQYLLQGEKQQGVIKGLSTFEKEVVTKRLKELYELYGIPTKRLCCNCPCCSARKHISTVYPTYYYYNSCRPTYQMIRCR